MSLSRKNSHFSFFRLIRVLIFQFALYQISRATSIIDTTSLSSTQGIILPISTSSQSITSSSTGDFNGDGFEDILIGLPYYSSSTLSACGIVYVIFGTANGILNINPSTMSLSDGFEITGHAMNSNLGFSVAGLGDINGDTIDDFAIGSQGTSYAYVIFGKTNGQLVNIDLSSTDISTTNQGIVMMGVARLGTQVDSAGDFNDDGVNDFMVSSTNVFIGRGAVYVVFGKASISSYFDLSSITLTPPDGFVIVGEASSQLGRSLSKLGDVNGDGIEDIMAGTNGVTGGMVIIVYGTKTPTSTVQADTLLSSQGIIITGSSSSTIGARDSINSVADLNNDGVDDIALGVPTYSVSPITSFGMVYIVYGQKGGFSGNINLSSSWNGFQVKGVLQSSWKFGNSITSADINGDGLADLIVGTPGATAPAGSTAGIFYILFGNVNGFLNIDLANSWSQSPQVLKVYGDATGFQLGSLVKPAKDFNKDGVNDFVSIGTRNAYVFYGDECESLVQCDSASLSPICYASKGCVCGEYGLYFLENACVSQCAEGYYANTAICESCPVSCATCTSPSVCQACNEGYIFSGTTCEAIPQVLSGTATALDHAQVAASIATIVMTILAFTNPGPIVIVSLSRVFLALKLMKIDYPPRLEYLLENSGSGDSIFDQVTSPPEALVDHMTNYSLPEKFKDVGFYSNFLVNFWPSLITIIGVITLALVAIFLNYCIIPSRIGTYTKTKKIAFWLHSKFKQAVKWNLLISTFMGCLGDIGMFTTLELRALHFDSILEGLSFNICLALNISGIFIQVLLIYVVWKLRKAHAQSRQKNNPNIFQNAKKKLESYRVIFEVFKEDTFLQQSFLFIFNFKMYFFFAVISYFPDYPLVPTLVNSIVGLFVLLYLTLVRPHKEKIEFASLLIAEVLYEITNICAFLLALNDTYDLNFGNSRIRLGDVIIVCNCTFMTLALAFLAIQIFNLIKDIYSFIRELIKQRKNRDNNKDVTSIEQYSLNLSCTAKSAESSLQIHKNSNGLDSHINLFERRITKPRTLSLLAKIQDLQDLDDHEIAQVQLNNIDHTDNDTQAQEITGINLPINSNNGLQDLVGRNILIDKNQIFLPPSRLLPAKTIQNPWAREQND